MCQCTIVLGMEVWQSVDGIFLGQGEYAVEILKRFKMMECMTTPMASNMKLLSDASSETVDATMYRQMIGSLMYLRLDTCLAMKMDSSMMRMRRLTWRVMLIHIGHAVPSTGRVLRDVASVWDQV